MTELEHKVCFMLQVKWNPCLADVAQKLIKPMVRALVRSTKNYLTWVQSLLRYGKRKIRNFELFYLQHCWSD
ncbi:hypothetical protein O3M35_009150 [Rhynocoris fuscipes]|uniref:Uncharacterized protein n=1 Tax=Rhynocoris fuscipes TaxID=488301 RepID=A0AAW1D393_9HEMI